MLNGTNLLSSSVNTFYPYTYGLLKWSNESKVPKYIASIKLPSLFITQLLHSIDHTLFPPYILNDSVSNALILK